MTWEPTTPEIADATRYEIIKTLPIVFQDDPSGKLEPFLDTVNTVIEQIRKYLVRIPRIHDIDQVPDQWIYDLSRLIGNDFDYFAPTDGSKRKKIKALVDLYKHKGIDYVFRFVWQQYSIEKVAKMVSMSDHLMVYSTQGGLSVKEDKDSEYLTQLILHDFGDSDPCSEWRGHKNADSTIDENLDVTYVHEGKTSGHAIARGVAWERMAVSRITGYEPRWYLPQHDATGGWNYFDAAFDGEWVYFAPTDSTVFVRYNATHQGDDTWRIYDTTAWETIEQKRVLDFNQQSAFYGACFDGRFIYFAPYAADTFIRFDTEYRGGFNDSSAWQHIGIRQVFRTQCSGTGSGRDATDVPRFAFTFCDYDGKWIYYSPNFSDSFVRFDTSRDFSDAQNAWESCAWQVALDGQHPHGHIPAVAKTYNKYYGAICEDDWIYFVPMNADTFLRFNKKGIDSTSGETFKDGTAWQSVSKDTVYGYSAIGQQPFPTFVGGVSDGRFIYFVPRHSEKFLRFDSGSSSGSGKSDFDDESCWHKYDIPSAIDSTSAEDQWAGAIYDGQYIYFVPDKANTIVRYNTLSAYFQTENSWEHIHLSSAMGCPVSKASYVGGCYDGRFIYFSPLLSDRFLRYDTECRFNSFLDQDVYNGIGCWRTTDFPRKYKFYDDPGNIVFWVYVSDIDALDVTGKDNFRFEIGLEDNKVYDQQRVVWLGKLTDNGWNRLSFNTHTPDDSTGMMSGNNYVFTNMDSCKFYVKQNPDNHKDCHLYFDELKWIDPETKRGMHGAYIQDGLIHHEASIIIDTHEWIEDSKTLKELIDDIFPLGFHPWIKFERWFYQELHPDSTANWTWMGTIRYKMFHRRKDMNCTWLLSCDKGFGLDDHSHVEDSWPPYTRHDSPGPYIKKRYV